MRSTAQYGVTSHHATIPIDRLGNQPFLPLLKGSQRLEWHMFLSDPEIDTSLGYQPPEKHLVGKLLHDVLASITAMLEWLHVDEPHGQRTLVPEPTRRWLLNNVPLLYQERASISTLCADFISQTDTRAGWLERVEDIGKRTSHIAQLKDDLPQPLQTPPLPTQDPLALIRHNLLKLALIGKDIQDGEYKRLWTLDYDELAQTP